jgi:hypothetical protein
LEDSIADILLTRDQETSDAQMIEGMESATSVSFHFAPGSSMAKLEELVLTETPSVRQAACKYLRIYSEAQPYTNRRDYAGALTSDPNFVKALAECEAKAK